MTKNELLAKFRNLNVWGAGDRRAPHKPLLVLLMLGRIIRGDEDPISFVEANIKMTGLLQNFGPHRNHVNPHYPFWRLQNDGIWEIPERHRIKVTSSGDAHKNSLVEENAHGRFTKPIRNVLFGDKTLAFRIVFELIEAHFPASLHNDIFQELEIVTDANQTDSAIELTGTFGDFGIQTIYRRLRSHQFAKKILRNYNYRCAVCEFSVVLDDRPVALEAAHIKWHAAGGPDQISNGISLCVLHHQLFDRGAFTLSKDRKIVLANSLQGHSFENSLGQFENQTLIPPINSEKQPAQEFIEWHRSEVFRGEAAEWLC